MGRCPSLCLRKYAQNSLPLSDPGARVLFREANSRNAVSLIPSHAKISTQHAADILRSSSSIFRIKESHLSRLRENRRKGGSSGALRFEEGVDFLPERPTDGWMPATRLSHNLCGSSIHGFTRG
jgi:hypothetical protein